MKTRTDDKFYKTIIFYTLSFFIIASIVFLGFYARGKSLLLGMDSFNQHFVIFKNYHEIIKNGFSLFAWNIGLGEGVIGEYAYYVMGDPFFYLSLPFSVGALKYIYSLLIILRIYCCGLTFLFLCRYKKKDAFSSLIGSLAYSFSSYVLLFSFMHPYFANAAILLPLLFIGIEKFLKENNYKYIIILYFTSIICNFYFCYMLVILSLIYAFGIYLFEIDHKSLKDFIAKLIKAAICFGISILLSSFILLPVLYAFKNSGRIPITLMADYNISYYKNLIHNLFIISDSGFSTTIGCSSLLLLMLPIVLGNYKSNKSILFFTFLLMIGLITPMFGKVMNGFHYCTNRWTFALCFCFSYLIVCGLNNKLKYKPIELTRMTMFMIFYCTVLIGLHINDLLIVFKSLIPCSAILIIVAAYNLLFHNNDKFRPIVKILVLLLVFLNLGYIGYKGYSPYIKNSVAFDNIDDKYNSLNGNLTNYDKAIALIKKDEAFYRIGRFPRWFQNAAQYFDYKSPNTYLSISNNYLKSLSDDLHNFDVSVNKTLLEFDNRTRITTLMGEKYFITDKNNVERLPYAYSEYASIGDLGIYKNDVSVSPIVFYNRVLSRDEWLKANPLDREYLITKAAVLDQDDLLDVQMPILDDYSSVVTKVDYEIADEDKEKIDAKKIVVNDVPYVIKFRVQDIIDKELYLCIKNFNYTPFTGNNLANKISINVNGVNNYRDIEDKNSSQWYYPMDDFYINLGSYSSDKEIEYIINKQGTYTFDEMELYAVDMTEYEDDMKNLSQNVAITEVNSNGIVAKIDNDEDGIIQLATGYSKGFQVYVDGQRIDSFVVNSGFVGAKIPKGTHIVKFVYETPYLKLGLCISITICVIIISLTMIKKIYDKRNESD